ncbi:MAG: hypothetical protein ACP5IL_08645 [Syntrophobacteraceae bacterium]
MNPDFLFEKFPDILLSAFRKQMLLGIVPAAMVEQVLKPLLSDFHAIMLQLPAEVRTDVENILRIYPEVGERFKVYIKPPVIESLRYLARYRLTPGSVSGRSREEFDMVAQNQKGFETTRNRTGSFANEGQGFFTTDRGNPVYIEFCFSEAQDSVCFEYIPPRLGIDIHICGIFALALTPQKPRGEIPVERFLEILRKCPSQVEIEIIEKT